MKRNRLSPVAEAPLRTATPQLPVVHLLGLSPLRAILSSSLFMVAEEEAVVALAVRLPQHEKVAREVAAALTPDTNFFAAI